MNTHADREQEKKSRVEAESLSPKQGEGPSASIYMANRPEVLAIDTLQKMENGSPRGRQLKAFQDRADGRAARQLRTIQKKENWEGSLGNSEPVVQRAVEVGGVTYRTENKGDFEAIYDQEHRAAMVTALLDQGIHTIEAALADARTFPLEIEDLGGFLPGVISYQLNLDELPAAVLQVEGGFSRSAGARPELVTRPEAGFEQIDISGLLMCVGIVIEDYDEGGTNAAVGAHFVTPDEIEGANLNDRGVGQLNTMLELIGGFGGELAATLCYAPGQNGDPSGDTIVALDLINGFLTDRGVGNIQVIETGADITYRLLSNGMPSLE